MPRAKQIELRRIAARPRGSVESGEDDEPANRLVVIADWCFTTPAIVIQPVTGYLLMKTLGFTFNTPWIQWTLALYLLAALTSVACMALLFRGYARTGMRLLLWSALCFVGLSVNNVLLFVDLALLPTQVDLRPWRLAAAIAGLAFLLYAFIWEAE